MSAQGLNGEVGKLTYFAEDKNEHLRQAGINLSNRLIGVAQPDRQQPFYILGPGDGGSAMILNMASQDIQAGRGVAVIDPLGKISEQLLSYVPKERQKDLIYINAGDTERPFALNLLEQGEAAAIGNQLVSVFHDIWHDSWGPSLEHVLRNSLMALAHNPKTTLLHVNSILVDDDFREVIVKQVDDPVVKTFWQKEFPVFRKRPERLMSVQNKMGALASQPILRNIIGQTKSTIKFNEVIAGQRILIVNLAKTRLGPEATSLLGSLILSGLQQAVMTRAAEASTAEENEEENTGQPNFNLYITDCHNVMTRGFTTLLSENYGLNVVLANQYLGQLVKSGDTSIRDAVLGNAGSLVCFRLGLGDAEVLERHFAPDYTANDLIMLSDYQIIYKLIKNGRVDEQQKVNVLTAPAVQNHRAYREKLIKKSRRHFGRNRTRVEEHINNSLNVKAWLNQVGHVG